MTTMQARWAAIVVAVATAVGCGGAPAPSIVLMVFDTTRADATMPYGSEVPSTPTLAALAREGVVYERAYAQAPWTLPSHATLFTGLLPSEHGVGAVTTHAPDRLALLAEDLAAAGYQTLGMSENPWIHDTFNMTQGFEAFESVRRVGRGQGFRAVLDGLLEQRDPARPLFLFVNVMDAHGPYQYRAREPFVPPETSQKAANAAVMAYRVAFCRHDVPERTWRTVRQIYLGGVRRADAKLAMVLDALRPGPSDRPIVTIVTSDHGQHFGEHGLTSHLYSVREPLLRVPLVVHGVPGRDPARIATPVGLAAVWGSIRELAGVGAADDPRLPVADVRGESPVVRAEYFETADGALADAPPILRVLGLLRVKCGLDDRVFGNMRAVIRGRHKLIDFERYPDELFDVVADPGETIDLSGDRETTRRELQALVSSGLAAWPEEGGAERRVPSEVVDQLRALGYMTDERE